MDAFGSASERSHKNVPLLISTRGYGLFLNTGRRSTWDLGTESCESYTLAVDGPYLDAYLIYGPTPAEVLERYTQLTGRAPLPPKWSFGVWLSGGGLRRDQRAMQQMVDQVAEHDLPCDVIHVDTWWMRWRQYADFRWDRQAFPDPEAFARGLHRQGLRAQRYGSTRTSRSRATCYAEGCRGDYFVRRPDGEAYVIDYGLSLAPLPAGCGAGRPWAGDLERSSGYHRPDPSGRGRVVQVADAAGARGRPGCVQDRFRGGHPGRCGVRQRHDRGGDAQPLPAALQPGRSSR